MRLVLLAAIAVTAACYDPTLRNCTVTCLGPGECAEGQVCGADGLCAIESIAGRCAAFLDGGVIDGARIDGGPAVIDATPSPCEARCVDGTCVGGVCEITCGTDACAATVECPDGVPCRVRCDGDRSCNGGVRCGDDRCEVECAGKDSCSNEVRCATAACVVRCSGKDACANTVTCADACACDVLCTGNGACDGAAECPRPPCDTGLGCTSAAPACDAC